MLLFKFRHGIRQPRIVAIAGGALKRRRLAASRKGRWALATTKRMPRSCSRLDEGPQLFRGGHVDVRDGPRIENHLANRLRSRGR